MKDGSILLFPAGPDPVGQVIKDITGSPYAHVAICVGGLIFDDTVWEQPGRLLPVSGVRVTEQANAASLGTFIVRDLLVPWIPLEVEKALQVAITQVNLRRRYNIALLLFDAVIYPTRGFWKKLGWAPFEHARDHVCSTFDGLVVRAAGRDPWPGVQTQELVPGDFATNAAWVNASS